MSDESVQPAPKEWRGRFYEDFEVGDVFRSRLGRTITQADNVWFTCLTMNTNQIHFNVPYSERTRFKQPLVNSTLTLALVTGLSVADTSENAASNLGWTDVRLPSPVFVGDTLWSESEVLSMRPSRSDPEVGIVTIRSSGVNQKSVIVITFRRTFMIYRRSAANSRRYFPPSTTPWGPGTAVEQ